ncbi:MAG: hypothetical protein ACK4TN_03670 [Brevinematales bacterium]
MSVLTIYRNNGAIRFSADPLRGVVFVSFARPISGKETAGGGKKYRWEEKVTIALSPQEASIIGAFSRLTLAGQSPKKNPVISHTPEKFGKKGLPKTLKVEKRDDSIFFSIAVKDETVTVGPIGFADLYMIDSFLSRFIPEILPKPRVPVPPTPEAEIEETKEEVVKKEEEILF